MRLRQLIQALDLPRRDFQRDREDAEFEFREHKLDPVERGRRNYAKGKQFEDEVAALYRLLGFETKLDTGISGVQIDLMIRQKFGGMTTEAVVECKDKRITSEERNQILAQQNLAQRKLPRHRWIAVSSQGFAADTRTALEDAGIDCVTYADPNGRFLVAAGSGGRLQFWDHKTGQTFLYRYYFGPGAWLDLLPDGRFDCSPEALRYLGYTENGTLRHYPAESLVKEFHSPEAVQAVLAKYI